MRISNIKLTDFKNYQEESFAFHPGFNCLVGLNGMGKTNVLDGIHYLAFTKSAFLSTDLQNIRHEERFFVIHGEFESENPLAVTCYQERGKKKVFKINKADPEKISDHIGIIPLILSTPYDTAIIREGSEVRRKFMDGTLSQINKQYLTDLLQYQKVLRQRNALLKNFEMQSEHSLNTLLDIYDEELIELSLSIAQQRQNFTAEFASYFVKSYQAIASPKETTSIEYETQILDEGFKSAFKAARKKDLITQRTTMGCHRDDLVFQLNHYPVKKIGSQGQQKSFLIALRLAQYDYLKDKKNDKPILMLDDVLDKLDDERIKKLIELLSDRDRFGQVILTDARIERINVMFNDNPEVKFFELANGKSITHD